FIFANSVVALLGYSTAGLPIPSGIGWMAVAAVAGGAIGAQLGSRYLPASVIKWLLAGTLLTAGFRLVWF
ncbi:MAG: hypothetical protein ACK4VV_16975, partial [Pseudomonas sp.]